MCYDKENNESGNIPVVCAFGVAGLYFLLDYTFLGAAQISVYAGGVTIIYILQFSLSANIPFRVCPKNCVENV